MACTINYKLLPVKAHYFFFMAVAGSILPFLPVLARSLGVTAAVLGFITSLLPVAVLIAKPGFGALSDRFPRYRHQIFMVSVIGQSVALAALGVVPAADPENVYQSAAFWSFVLLMCIGNVCFNVANSLSDAICFEVLGAGNELQYGQQRVWGSFGWGSAALISGVSMSWWGQRENNEGLAPACLLTLVFGVCDTLSCLWLQLPERKATGSMLRDLINLVRHRSAALFLVFAAMIGVLDGFLIYYLLWYLEDLAGLVNAEPSVNIKWLEGLVVAAQTLGGEVLFFPISGWILKRLGHSYCLTLVFSVYSVRLMLLSVAPGPWWLLPIELFLQGPTYALGYSTIVAYASAVAPEGTQATVQGIAAGVDDSLGYSIGSLLGGQLYRLFGGRGVFMCMAVIALSCCLAHFALQSALRSSQATKPEVARESPEPTNVTLLDARKPSVTPKITESANLKSI